MTKKFERKIIFILSILLFLIGTSDFAQNKKDTLKVLFVGNSYTHVNNLPQITSILSDGVKTKLITKSSTVGGGKLKEHWLGERKLKTKEIIKNGNFDIVVLQGFSMSTIEFPDTLTKYAGLFCDYIKKNGAKPYLYLTWARKKVPQYQETIDSVYYSIAKENNVKVVPVGKAWQLAQQLRPDIQLFQNEGSHPSKLGTLLTASVFVAALTGELPDVLPKSFRINDSNGEPVLLMYFWAENKLDLVYLKKIVEEVVLNKR